MELTIEQLVEQLRTMPRLEPDPRWKRRVKTRLLQRMARRGRMEIVSRWVVFATYEQDPIDFANWVRAKGRDWRPLAVDPERLEPALANLQPNLVVIDARLPRRDMLASLVREHSVAERAIIANQNELARIA